MEVPQAGLHYPDSRTPVGPWRCPVSEGGPGCSRQTGRESGSSGSVDSEWLGGKDSNLDKQIQSLPSYHWTTPQENERPKGAPLDVETMKDRSTKVKVKS